MVGLEVGSNISWQITDPLRVSFQSSVALKLATNQSGDCDCPLMSVGYSQALTRDDFLG